MAKSVDPQKVFKGAEYDAMMHALRLKPINDRESLQGVEKRLRYALCEHRNTKSAHPIDIGVVADMLKALGQKVPGHA